jgi:hypothetical protein
MGVWGLAPRSFNTTNDPFLTFLTFILSFCVHCSIPLLSPSRPLHPQFPLAVAFPPFPCCCNGRASCYLRPPPAAPAAPAPPHPTSTVVAVVAVAAVAAVVTLSLAADMLLCRVPPHLSLACSALPYSCQVTAGHGRLGAVGAVQDRAA